LFVFPAFLPTFLHSFPDQQQQPRLAVNTGSDEFVVFGARKEKKRIIFFPVSTTHINRNPHRPRPKQY